MRKRYLSNKNELLKKHLQNKVVSLNKIIEPGFKFGYITKKDNPKEYFVALVLYKINSLNISIENVIFANDVFLSIYLYRYAYELYTKVFYIFSGHSEKEKILKVKEFYKNKTWLLSNIVSKSNIHLAEKHKENYSQICKFVHPNIDSLNLHYSNRTDDQQFEFLVPNVQMTVWFFVGIIMFFSDQKLLNLDTRLDQKKLVSLQNI